MARRAPAQVALVTLALLQALACAKSPGAIDPVSERIVDVRVVNLDGGGSLPAGYQLLRSVSGDTTGGDVNLGLWNDTVPAHRVLIAYRWERTADPVGISELHVGTSDAAVETDLFGPGGHDALYGGARPGCAANPVDLNAATCRSASLSEWYSGWCAYYFWDAACAAAGTPLFLHHRTESQGGGAIRCLVVGDEVALDGNLPVAARRTHLWWGPDDANRDGTVDEADADWVLANVRWVSSAGGQPVNLNRGTQSFQRYNWYDCGAGQGYDDAWWHAPDDVADAQYLGYCPP